MSNIHLAVQSQLWVKLLHAAQFLDYLSGGNFDASGGMVINLWAQPHNHPIGMNFTRPIFVGSIVPTYCADWRILGFRPKNIGLPDLNELWARQQICFLINLTEERNLTCPFCDWPRPYCESANVLYFIQHLVEHKVEVDRTKITTKQLTDTNGRVFNFPLQTPLLPAVDQFLLRLHYD